MENNPQMTGLEYYKCEICAKDRILISNKKIHQSQCSKQIKPNDQLTDQKVNFGQFASPCAFS
jgi:hypothetical protein